MPMRNIKEIFSNFSDVRALAKETLQRLEEGASIDSPTTDTVASNVGTIGRFFFRADNVKTVKSVRAYIPPPMAIPRNVGTILLPILPFFKCYSLFVGNFANAQTVLEREDKGNERWRKFVKAKQVAGVGRHLSLSAMFLNIVQRIPRYRLLIGVSQPA